MKNNYNLIAKHYDLLVQLVFGKKLYESQIIFLHHLPAEAEVLFIGGGSGNILKEICRIRPEIHLTYIESSKKMLQLAKLKLNAHQRKNVLFIHGNEDDIPDKSYDVIISFYLLDLYLQGNVERIFRKLNDKLKAQAYWFIADFRPPKNIVQKILEKAMYLFLEISTQIESRKIPELEYLFKEFKLLKMKNFYNDFIFSAVFRKNLTQSV